MSGLGLVPVGESLNLAELKAQKKVPLLKDPPEIGSERGNHIGFCKCLAAHVVQVSMIRNSNLLRRNSTKPN